MSYISRGMGLNTVGKNKHKQNTKLKKNSEKSTIGKKHKKKQKTLDNLETGVDAS